MNLSDLDLNKLLEVKNCCELLNSKYDNGIALHQLVDENDLKIVDKKKKIYKLYNNIILEIEKRLLNEF